MFDDDLFPRVGRACRIGPFGDVDDAPVEAHGVVLVDLPHVVQRAQVEELGVVRGCLPPCRLCVGSCLPASSSSSVQCLPFRFRPGTAPYASTASRVSSSPSTSSSFSVKCWP